MKALALTLPLLALLSGCLTTRHEVVLRVEPIYAQIDVNLRVQQQLDDIFGEIDAASESGDYVPAEQLEDVLAP